MLLLFFFMNRAIIMSDPAAVNIFPYQIVITEILADPVPSYGLPEAEYIEIYNRSPSAVNLSQYKLFDGSEKPISGLTLLPGEYAIICDDDDTSEFAGYGKRAWVSSLSLTNGGEAVVLYNTNGQVVDSVYYSANWYGNSFKEDGGWSLERVDTAFTCHDPMNWVPSEDLDGGTPAYTNSVAGVFMDTNAPIAINAYPVNDYELVIRFSEQIELLSPAQIICTAPGPVIHTGFYQDKKNEILASLAGQMQPSEVYMMNIAGIQDCTGNINQNDTVIFGLPAHSHANKVRINEVLYDPAEPCSEYIEIINISDSIVDLADYEICTIGPSDGIIESVYEISDEPFLLFPRGIVYLSEDIQTVADCYTSGPPETALQLSDMPSLLNSGGRLGIMYLGELIDDILYDDDMHHPLLSTTKGVSLELIDDNAIEYNTANWMSASSASGYGTPGMLNSQRRSAGFTEEWLAIDPVLFSPDNNGHDDFTTIILSTDAPGYIMNIRIFDRNGFAVKQLPVRSLATGTNRITWMGDSDESKMVLPGPYIVHVTIFDHKGRKKTGKLLTVVSE